MEGLIYFLIGVIVGFLLGMFKARKWWLAYNGGYGRVSDTEEETRLEREL